MNIKRLLISSLVAWAISAQASSCPILVGDKDDGKYPRIFIDKAAFEKKHNCHMVFKENPAIKRLNMQIKGNPKVLPAVARRLPQEPLVIVPYQAIGTYGGRFDGISNSTEAGSSDLLSVRHVNLVRYSDDLNTVVPNVAKSLSHNDDFTQWTITLREGHNWSDGEPFTADDIVFWYNNLMMDAKVIEKPNEQFLSDGKPWKVEATDSQTVRITMDKAQPGLPEMLALNYVQPFQPKHLLAQFDPKSNKNADALAQKLGFKDGYDALTFYYGQSDWKDVPTPINKDKAQANKMVAAGYPATAPTLESFIVVEDDAEGRRLVANPYFFQVDTAGNQLPYINEIKEVFIGDEDIRTAKMLAGEVTYKAQSVNLPSAPVLLENRQTGGYNIALRPNVSLTAFSFNVNDKDRELRKIFSDIRFRKAVTHGIDRDKMNDVAFLKLGKPTQYTVFDADTTAFVTAEQRNYLIDYKPQLSKALLAQMGLKDSDGDGVLELPSGQAIKLVFKYTTQGVATQLAEIFAKNMTDIGIKTTLKEIPSDEYRNLQSANDLHILEWHVGALPAELASDPSLFKPPYGGFFSLVNGLEWKKYHDTNGKEGIAPPAEIVEIGRLADAFTALKTGTKVSDKLGRRLIDKWLEQLLIIGTVKGVSPIYYSAKLGNFAVPKTSSYAYYRVYPYLPTQWFIKQ